MFGAAEPLLDNVPFALFVSACVTDFNRAWQAAHYNKEKISVSEQSSFLCCRVTHSPSHTKPEQTCFMQGTPRSCRDGIANLVTLKQAVVHS